MRATVSTFPRQADTDDDAVRTAPAAGSAPAGTVAVEHEDDAGRTVVTFWPDDGAVPEGRVYDVVDGLDGPAAGRTPLFAQLTWLNGAGDPAVARAAERGGRERIHPAVRDVDGLVGITVLRSADDHIVVLGLATGTETLAEMRERIDRTELLPGEDPALLPGPDRTALGRVLRADLPAQVRS